MQELQVDTTQEEKQRRQSEMQREQARLSQIQEEKERLSASLEQTQEVNTPAGLFTAEFD